jgi:NADH-quinone oxidoreductase subunit C
VGPRRRASCRRTPRWTALRSVRRGDRPHELVAGDEHIVYVDREPRLEILAWLRDDPEQRYDFLQDLTAVDYGNGAPPGGLPALVDPHKLNLR